MRTHYQQLIDRIGALSTKGISVSEDELMEVAQCIEANQIEAKRVLRRVSLPKSSCLFVDTSCHTNLGAHTDLSQAFIDLGQHVVTHSEQADVVLSPLPQAESTHSSMQVYFSYGLRLTSTTVSDAYVTALNEHARGVVVPTRFLLKLLTDAGVYAPISVQMDGLDNWINLPAANRAAVTIKNYLFVCDITDVKNDGLDVLLSAYGQAFVPSDNVSLLVLADTQSMKEARAVIDAWRAEQGQQPEVQLLSAVDESVRKATFLQSHCLVAPCRFQDVGLSITRARALSLRVLTTGWGGQREIGSLDVSEGATDALQLIDYRFVRANSSSSLFNAYWAEPDQSHLARLMREQYFGGVSALSSDSRLQTQLYSASASALNQLARGWSAGPISRPFKIGWISTWNTRCGIASYSEHLTECMTDDVVVFAPRQAERLSRDADHVVRCWDHADTRLDELSAEIERRGINALVVQFNYGFFHFPAMIDFLTTQAARGVKTVVTLHSTSDPVHAPDRRLETLVPALGLCHRVLVHSVGDLNRLKHLGLSENVTLFPLGVKESPPDLDLSVQHIAVQQYDGSLGTREFVLASYGFFLPHKGLLELIDAVGILRARGCKVSLSMVNAEYPISDSQDLVRQARAKVVALGLEPYVRFMTDFLADEESLSLLQQADLVVYPYQVTGESASAAVRFGLAAKRPVVVTPLAIFDDVDAAVFRLPGFTAGSIAEGVEALMTDFSTNAEETLNKLQMASAWRSAHQFSKLSNRLTGILKA